VTYLDELGRLGRGRGGRHCKEQGGHRKDSRKLHSDRYLIAKLKKLLILENADKRICELEFWKGGTVI
jgi:hypothetical protein